MQITDILAQLGGLQSIARELGVSETQAASGAEALVPAILGGFKRQAQSQPAGLEGLGSLLGQLGGGGLLDQVLAPQPTDVGRGNDVLGQIFGSKDVSRAVAQHASSRSGLDPSLLKKMLPMLAMAVAGFMANQSGAGAVAQPARAGGGLGGLLGGLLGGAARSGRAPAGGAGGGLAAMLDLDGDGNPLDDILGMAGKARNEELVHPAGLGLPDAVDYDDADPFRRCINRLRPNRSWIKTLRHAPQPLTPPPLTPLPVQTPYRRSALYLSCPIWPGSDRSEEPHQGTIVSVKI